jgi:hypothetical protein
MTFSSIEIKLGGLSVSVQTELTYPDGLHDMTSRALEMFHETIEAATTKGIDITTMTLHTGIDEEDF